MTTRQEKDKMASKIKDWLIEEGHLKTAVDKDANEEHKDLFRYVVSMGNTTLEMFQPADKQDCVVVVAVTNFSKEHQAGILAPGNMNVLNRLQLELIRGGVQVDMKVGPPPSGVEGAQPLPLAFAILDIMYYDAITKDMLYQRLQRMVNVRVAGVIMLNMLLGPGGKEILSTSASAKADDRMFG
jgi:hypothetical protein